MKLFGGGKPVATSKGEQRDEEAGYFDSPTETVSLSAPRHEPAVVAREEAPTNVDYGINAAIQLMRSLPIDKNPELVVTVVKTTLESLHVKIADIIADAGRKQADLEKRVEMLTKEISDFEREITQRKEEIGRLEADHLETSKVKERLELAERGPSTPPGDKTKSKTA